VLTCNFPTTYVMGYGYAAPAGAYPTAFSQWIVLFTIEEMNRPCVGLSSILICNAELK
jgi:hypothetical protein